MKSLQELYRIGMGPSSSHTMGPRRAAALFAQRTPAATRYRVVLEGSLAATGKGHLTDRAIQEALPEGKEIQIEWAPQTVPAFHPNGMLFIAYDPNDNELTRWQVFSVGGGALREEGRGEEAPEVYQINTAADLLAWVESSGNPIWRLVYIREQAAGIDIDTYLHQVWEAMREAIQRGLQSEEPMPGPLHLQRHAHTAYAKSRSNAFPRTALVSAYALAAAEENGSGGIVATAPTCGGSGVIPGLFRYMQDALSLDDTEIIQALATAGIFGNLIKQNASISGAEVGCQGEVGAACAMAAAGAAQMLGGTASQIEAAAEMGLEHHLGLTCDPVYGLVQIPCIERNAMAALRALTCAEYALLFDGHHRISFDQVVETMRQTGLDMPAPYRETSQGGLARWFQENIEEA